MLGEEDVPFQYGEYFIEYIAEPTFYQPTFYILNSCKLTNVVTCDHNNELRRF